MLLIFSGNKFEWDSIHYLDIISHWKVCIFSILWVSDFCIQNFRNKFGCKWFHTSDDFFVGFVQLNHNCCVSFHCLGDITLRLSDIFAFSKNSNLKAQGEKLSLSSSNIKQFLFQWKTITTISSNNWIYNWKKYQVILWTYYETTDTKIGGLPKESSQLDTSVIIQIQQITITIFFFFF